MNLEVDYLDQKENQSTLNIYLSRLAFIKHLAVAGQGYSPTPKKIMRIIGMFFHYSYYLRRTSFYKNKFSTPPSELYDPTEKGQFSNLAGKAIADFLSKRIDKSLFTVNYEAAMKLRGISINGSRPDLLAFTSNAQFALEAKGYSNGPGNMGKHKSQASSGPIPVNFSVASVAYNLYVRVKCNYHDPFNENIPYDNEMLSSLSRDYYLGLLGFLQEYPYSQLEYQGEKFYAIELEPLPFRLLDCICFFCKRFYLILPEKIESFSEYGITKDIQPFFIEKLNERETIYIDNDRVGLMVK